MKKLLTLAITLALTFVLLSCSSSETVFTLYVVSDEQVKINAIKEDFEQELLGELTRLGTDFTQVVLEVGNSTIGLNKLENNEAHAIILDYNKLIDNTEPINRILSVAMVEENLSSNEIKMDDTYTLSVLATPSDDAYNFYAHTLRDVSTPFDPTFMLPLDVCLEESSRQYFEPYITNLSGTEFNTMMFNSYTISATESNLMTGLFNGTCEVVVAIPENVKGYEELYPNMLQLNEVNIVEDLQDFMYEGVYTSSLREGELDNIIAQALINLSAHSYNRDILDALGHDSYKIYSDN